MATCKLCGLPSGEITRTLNTYYKVEIPDGAEVCTVCTGKRRVRALPITNRTPEAIAKLMPKAHKPGSPKDDTANSK